MIILDKASLRC